ncbi:hypothetical protein [Pseudomonas asiatica]|uniref:Uncharacterized protein n=1 Tax=Pseudomonas asiatica TaxID=2219225 RepID=A0A9X4D4A0_9PSED|nr:hypothetical protein [Pseudomonas asiatica]MDD2109307.1 hypothetical protein [Pseudomonas asiatica]
MSTFVQLDDSESRVIGVFSCAQDPDVWGRVVLIEDDDDRLVEYFENLRKVPIKDA